MGADPRHYKSRIVHVDAEGNEIPPPPPVERKLRMQREMKPPARSKPPVARKKRVAATSPTRRSPAKTAPPAKTTAQLERELDLMRAERCFDESGALDSRKVQEFARERGISFATARERLLGNHPAAGDGGGREDVSIASRAERYAREHGVDLTTATVEVQRAPLARAAPGPVSGEESIRVADEAERLVARETAAGRPMSYADALVQVQRVGSR